MGIEVIGPVTPYITPEILTAAPTGISWRTIPNSRATAPEQYAEQMNLCARATAMVDSRCNQTLRAAIENETLWGPDYRVTVNKYTTVVRCELSRSPIIQVLGGQVTNAAAFPAQFTSIPADQFKIDRPVLGLYGTSSPGSSGGGGQSVMLGPGYIDWFNGRQGYEIVVQYVAGWPHASLTASVIAGASIIEVDDCTGWGPPSPGVQGAAGIIHDGANQEAVTCLAASTSSGPGTLVLAGDLVFGHGDGVVVSALPGTIMWAAILFAASEALTRGATATTIQSVSGTAEPAAAAGHHAMYAKAHMLLGPYARVI